MSGRGEGSHEIHAYPVASPTWPLGHACPVAGTPVDNSHTPRMSGRGYCLDLRMSGRGLTHVRSRPSYYLYTPLS